MTDITIPAAALEAGARALYSVRCKITAVASGARFFGAQKVARAALEGKP